MPLQSTNTTPNNPPNIPSPALTPTAAAPPVCCAVPLFFTTVLVPSGPASTTVPFPPTLTVVPSTTVLFPGWTVVLLPKITFPPASTVNPVPPIVIAVPVEPTPAPAELYRMVDVKPDPGSTITTPELNAETTVPETTVAGSPARIVVPGASVNGMPDVTSDEAGTVTTWLPKVRIWDVDASGMADAAPLGTVMTRPAEGSRETVVPPTVAGAPEGVRVRPGFRTTLEAMGLMVMGVPPMEGGGVMGGVVAGLLG